MIRNTGICILFLFCSLAGAGQKNIADSVYQIPGVEVSTDRFSNTLCGVKVDDIDTVAIKSFLYGNLDQLLIQHSSVYIKSNGITGLSSVSVRGTGTSHTAVLWNGFNIQNPMNGGMDVSLVPAGFMNKISVQYNGMAALYGSGAVGGAIHLANEPEYNKGLEVAVGGYYGSFDNYSVNLKFGLSLKKTALMVKAFYHEGENDFSYINRAKFGSPKVRQTNSKMVSYGVIHDKAYKINERNQLTFRLWIQDCKRQLPPLMTQEFSTAKQNDDFFRAALEWMNKGEKYKLFVRTALLIDGYEYQEPEKLVNSSSGSTASVTESEIYFKLFPFHSMNIGLHYKYTSGFCDYYLHEQSQQELSAFASYTATCRKETWKLNLSLREEYSNHGFVPVLPSVAMDIRLYKDLLLYFNASRNYRIPTLNDLYWYPGGNPDLKPESGFAEEIGLKNKHYRKKTMLEYSISGFNHNIQNWIVWLPVSSYWSPQNIQAVWSRGGEAGFRIQQNIKGLAMTVSAKAVYNKATIVKSNSASAIGHQLIYTPEWMINPGIDIIYKTFSFNFNVEYSSKCYTAPDNTAFIDPYALGNLFISKDFSLKKFSFNVYLRINNIWNQSYQSVAWQAMPGINFNTGIQISFKTPINKNKK